MTQQPSPNDHRGQIFICIALCVFGFAIYFSSLANEFALDDVVHITQESKIHSIESALQSFKEPTFPGDLYRPLVTLSYAITYHFWKLAPFPYHLTNVILHLLNGLLIFILIRSLFGIRIGIWSTVLFLANPIHTEVVANISGRAELLAAFGILGTLCITDGSIAKEQHGGIWILGKLFRFLVAFVLSLIALLSKESSLVLILLLPLVAAFKRKHLFRSQLFWLLFIAVISAIATYLGLRLYALGAILAESQTTFLDNPLINLPTGIRLLNAVPLLSRYIFLSLIPYPLSADYSYSAILQYITLAPENALLLIATIVAIATALIGKRGGPLQFSMLWFFTSFAITANILFPIGTIFAERLAYLPSLGALLALSVLSTTIAGELFLWIVSVAYSILTVFHNPVWKDNSSLHSYQIEVSPQSAKTQLNYSMMLRQRGDLDGAGLHARFALQIYPKYADAAWALGAIYSEKGVNEGAKHYFEEALKIDPNHLRSINSLARVAIKSGNIPEARAKVNGALKIDPNDFDTRVSECYVLILEGKKGEAKKLFTILAEDNPNNPDVISIGKAISETRK